MRKNVLLVSTLCLIVSCASCKKFNWEAHPYSGDSEYQHLIDKNGAVVKCDQPTFDEMTCFDADNLAELIAEIDSINNLSDKQKKHLKDMLKVPALIDGH